MLYKWKGPEPIRLSLALTHTKAHHISMESHAHAYNNNTNTWQAETHSLEENSLGRLWHNHLLRFSQQHYYLLEPNASCKTVIAGGCSKSQRIPACALAGEQCWMNTDKRFQFALGSEHRLYMHSVIFKEDLFPWFASGSKKSKPWVK